ncbi:MAG: hypothetical protein AVDCRST_MAG85-4237, partial [uncultured Solirubrobacteraceae bacterium]
ARGIPSGLRPRQPAPPAARDHHDSRGGPL